MNIDTENVELDLKNLIKCALNNKISWPALKMFLDSATSTLRESKKLNNILLEELQSLQSKQIKEKKLDKAHEPSEKDVSALSPKIVQNWENDDEGISQVVESEKDYEIEMSTRIQSKDTIAQTQSDVLQRRIEAENSRMDDILIGRNYSEAPDDFTIPTPQYTRFFQNLSLYNVNGGISSMNPCLVPLERALLLTVFGQVVAF